MPKCARALAAFALALILACEDEAPPPPLAPAVPIERPEVIGPRSTATRVAYDLALAGGGAVLVWGTPSAQGGGLRAARLDAFGTRVGEDVRVYDPEIPRSTGAASVAPSTLELAASSAGGKVGITWVEQDGPDLRVRAVVGDAATGTFGAAQQLDESAVVPSRLRGHVGVASSPDGSFFGIYRGHERSCEEGGAARCVGFGVRPLGARAADDGRVPLAVPRPCDQAVAGIVSLGDRFYYGICAADEHGPGTTVYTIQLEPQYARSDRVLAGCTPLGATMVAGSVWVVGRCGEARRIARFDRGREGATELALSGGPVRCDGDRPVLPIADGVEVALDAPMDRLEPLLPSALLEGSPRAVWTGESLLLAVSLGRDVAVHRYECEYGELLRTDVL